MEAEAFCNHEETFDDIETADNICMQCGLVLDRILGCADDYRGKELTGQREEKRREKVGSKTKHYLDHFNIDNQFVQERVMHRYEKIYGRRKPRKGFRKDQNKDAVAMAFSIYSTLAENDMPHPPKHVSERVCGVEDKSMLQVEKVLKLSDNEMDKLDREDYEYPDVRAEDYVHVVCNYMSIKFRTAELIRYLIREWEDEDVMQGKYPNVIAATVIWYVLQRLSDEEEPAKKDASLAVLCDGLDCTCESVKALLKSLPERDYICTIP